VSHPLADDPALTTTMRRLAVEAGRAIMGVYGRPDFGTRIKSDDSPVTEADLAADRIIVEGLAAAFPGVPVVTEERAETHLAASGAHFLVDPLDGTKEFVERRGDFTVNIALVADGAPVAGVVYAPAVGRLFRTAAGAGAVEETGGFDPGAEGPLRPITVAAPDNQALRVVASKSHRDAATDAYIARYAVSSFKSAGSSLKFCLLAAGEADLYPRLGRTMEWDTAAGHAVLRAAGGGVVVLETGAPLTYGKSDRSNPWFVAYSTGVSLAPGVPG
jgi:3'(2'), 5'-bisphosphate nucleotidase